MIPGVLHLAECLDHCRQNQTCSSLNFETGLCVLLSSSARQLPQALTPSQFPVFTIYAEKICLKGLTNDCLNSGWSFERVIGYELREHEKKLIQTPTSLECMQACIDEDKFQCRSINYEEKTKECLLSDMNRHTININTEIRSMKYGPSSTGFDYLEFNCVQEPRKLCDFKPIEGKILKTVDSVYQNINNLEECQQKCLNGPFRCYSYDFGDPSNPVCRISHLDKVSLIQIENPYIDILGAATYELQACYDVNIKCESRAMTAKVRSSKIFDGKIYAKHKPYHCMSDINESLEFEIQMAYNDLECDVKQISRGQYSNDIVIQHHDMIVTTQDLGLNINCKYDLSNRSISNNVNLDITGNLQPIGTHSAVVESPNVTMTIINMDGDNVRAAKVGDPLISDQSSPYGMFVRELVALDGIDMSEFVLIDSDGCPTDMTIMKPIVKSRDDSKMFETNFEAFKFPTSDIVQFKALITPCITNCEPMNCQYDLPNGRTHSSLSYGRRRRRSTAKSRSANAPQNDMIVVESLSVTDKFSNKQKSKKKTLIEQNDHSTIYATIDG
ncbi:Zona pellucida-like and PAN domain containing protein [Sarcoptes scabiei]|uniref:Zona pellucida-like and PAN domain containing protein n=1 Tax=Sarcoptes scabiei TaxID=52283 RepID=A0A132A5S6_SARSC|nr:Zona pellucida-like and PAN domain containing protein [Sarcoptes scabiei]